MLNIVKKYISFDLPAHKHMEVKVDKCKTTTELIALFKDEKWIVSKHIIESIKADLDPKKAKDLADTKAVAELEAKNKYDADLKAKYRKEIEVEVRKEMEAKFKEIEETSTETDAKPEPTLTKAQLKAKAKAEKEALAKANVENNYG